MMKIACTMRVKIVLMEWQPLQTLMTKTPGILVRLHICHCSSANEALGPSSNIALLGEVSKMISLALKSKLQFQRDPSSTTEQRLVSRMQSPNQTTALATPRTPAFTNHCALPPWQRATALIEHFFSDTGMLFPYISKSYITSSYEAARTRNFSGVKRSWLCLLNMIFAFATFTKISPHESMENNILSSKPYFNRAHELLFESKFRLADLNLG